MATDLLDIEWKHGVRKLGELKDWEHNPRFITKEYFEKLKKSIKTRGLTRPIRIDTDNTIVGGHQTKRALLELGFTNDSDIDVRAPHRKLTDQEFKEINYSDNLPYGEYDYDVASSLFDYPELIELGTPESWLPSIEMDEEPGSDLELKPKRKPKQCPECGAEI